MRMGGIVALVACTLLTMPSQAQTAKGLSQEDVKKINEATQASVKAALAKDWTAWTADYLEDAVLFPPNQPAVGGRAAIRAWAQAFPPMTSFTLSNVKVEGRDDLAYVLGTYTLTMLPIGAPGPVKDSGKFIEIRRRQPDGRWLTAADIFNSDLPAVPSAAK